MPDQDRRPKRILIIAGEASGDMHGARLVKSLLARRPELDIFGVGGDGMAEAGARIEVHCSSITVMGLVEVFGRTWEILRTFGWVKKVLKTDPPDLVILIDFPDFNLRVAQKAAGNKVPVVYYISPQIWAWRKSRIRQIQKTVTQMLVIFPFEEAWYKRQGVPVCYVGHPLLDRFMESDATGGIRETAYGDLGLSPLYPVLGLFPGSRSGEIDALLPLMLRVAGRLHERFPRMQFLLGEAPGLKEGTLDGYLKDAGFPLARLRTGIGPDAKVCDLAVVASGTATMELALIGVPMVIVYRVSPVTYALARLLVRVPSFGMVNLVYRRPVVPELLQGELDETSLDEACDLFFRNSIYYATVKNEVAGIRAHLGKPGASERAASAVLEVLDRLSGTPRGATYR